MKKDISHLLGDPYWDDESLDQLAIGSTFDCPNIFTLMTEEVLVSQLAKKLAQSGIVPIKVQDRNGRVLSEDECKDMLTSLVSKMESRLLHELHTKTSMMKNSSGMMTLPLGWDSFQKYPIQNQVKISRLEMKYLNNRCVTHLVKTIFSLKPVS